MARINQIGYNLISGTTSFYTKRTCSDNSELYIKSKLDNLYKQAISKRNLDSSKRKLRKLVEGNNLDEIV